MEGKGYSNVEDFRGKLKEWTKEGVALSRQKKMEGKMSNASGDTQRLTASKNNSSLIIAVLFAIIAILLADKLNIVSL